MKIKVRKEVGPWSQKKNGCDECANIFRKWYFTKNRLFSRLSIVYQHTICRACRIVTLAQHVMIEVKMR